MLRLILRTITAAEGIVAAAAYTVVAALLILEVVGREFFAITFLGSEQLAVYGAIISGFLGLTLATSENAHLRPAFFDFVTRSHEARICRGGDLLSSLFFFGAAIVAAEFVSVSRSSADKAPILYFVLWPLQLVIPYTFASAGVKHLIFTLQPELKRDTSEVMH